MSARLHLHRPVEWMWAPAGPAALWEATDCVTGRTLTVSVRGVDSEDLEDAMSLLGETLDALGSSQPVWPEEGAEEAAWFATMRLPLPEGWLAGFLGLLRNAWCGVPSASRSAAGRWYVAPWAAAVDDRPSAMYALALAHRLIHRWWGSEDTPYCLEVERLREALDAPLGADGR